MPILDEQRFSFGGPYVYFADLPKPIILGEDLWPKHATYEEHVFFRMSDQLCDTLCSATRTYLPFAPHDFTQIWDSYDILQFSREWLFRAQILTATSTGNIRPEIRCLLRSSFYSRMKVDEAAASLHHDLLDTFLFLSGRFHQMAFSKRCLAIVGY